MSSRLAAALQLVEEYGLPVFPCWERDHTHDAKGEPRGRKSPRTPNGFKDASKNFAQLERWWTDWPDAFIGVPTGKPSGLFVVDIDPQGHDWYHANADRLRAGRIHPTERGWHLLYRDCDLKTTASTLAPGVDTRGDGGYIVWWPACGGRAPTGDLADVVDPPEWVVAALSQRKNAPPAPSKTAPPVTGDEGLVGDRSRDLLRRVAKDIRAGRADYEIVQLHRNHPHALDQADADRAVQRCIDRVRAELLPPTAPLRGTTPPEAPTWRLRRAEVDLAVLRAVRWVIEGIFPDEEQHTFAGQPGVGKTTAMGGLALVVAGYGPKLGSDLKNDRPRRVLIVSEHAPQYERLFFAYCRRYGLPPDEVADRVRLYHAARLALAEIQIEIAHVIEESAEAGADAPLVILDTAAASFALADENDNAEVGATLAELKSVVRETGAPCWVIAHAAKALGRNDAEITPRGASAFIGDAHGTASVFRDEALPDWIFLRSLKCRAVRAFDEIALQTFVEWHETVDERGVIQKVGIRLGVPRIGGEPQRKSLAVERAEAERGADEAALCREAELWAIDLIRRRGCAGIYSGAGPSARPAAIPAEAAITATVLKNALRRSSSTVQGLLEHLREWAADGTLEVEHVGAWCLLREKAGNIEVSPSSPRIPRGFPEDSPKIPDAPEAWGRTGARARGLQSPPAPLPPSSPTGFLKGEEASPRGVA
jgi:hypothetical protein